MFVEITDIDKAWELHKAGLLWEGYAFEDKPHGRASLWQNSGHMWSCHSRPGNAPNGGFRFYILLEE